MNINCIITDDEPIARSGLKGYVEKVDFLTLVGECEDAIQLNSVLKTKPVDLIFLDIEMPHMSGVDFLASLNNPPKVIITSAYEQYALKGYELDVTDYLLKPISFERFLKAVNKVHEIVEKESAYPEDEYMFVKSEKQLIKIFFKEIVFIESMENYIIIHTLTGKHMVYSTLKHISETLPEKTFLQVHRSFIIHIDKVKAIEGNMLKIEDFKIPVGRNMRDKVFNVLLNNRLISK